MSRLCKIFCGITASSITYAGTFLLTALAGKAGMDLTTFQHNMFRTGHAHAGVLAILCPVAQQLLDYADCR